MNKNIDEKNILEEVIKCSNEKDEEVREELITEIVEHITMFIKKENKDFDYSGLKNSCDEELINIIKEEVNMQTRVFLACLELKKLQEEERVRYYNQAYNGLYKEKETPKFICKKYDLRENELNIVYKLLFLSEEIIYIREYSKRRFIEMISDISGIHSEDAEHIWNLFNKEDVNFIISRKLTRLSMKIQDIEEQLEDTDSSVNILGDMLFNFLDILINEDDSE